MHKPKKRYNFCYKKITYHIGEMDQKHLQKKLIT